MSSERDLWKSPAWLFQAKADAMYDLLNGVSQALTLAGNIIMSGTLAVTGAVTMASTLAVTGATTLSSTLAAGATTITGALSAGATTVSTLDASGLASFAAGIKNSAGGTVTQITNITTGVTLSKYTGQITTVTAPSIAAAAEASFVVTNTLVAATDVVVVSVVTQFSDGLVIAYVSAIGANSFTITLSNLSTAAVSAGAAVISFAVIKGSAT